MFMYHGFGIFLKMESFWSHCILGKCDSRLNVWASARQNDVKRLWSTPTDFSLEVTPWQIDERERQTDEQTFRGIELWRQVHNSIKRHTIIYSIEIVYDYGIVFTYNQEM